eukprot:scaffold13303_cov70-Phaeocystis_antarctica.AAC.10
MYCPRVLKSFDPHGINENSSAFHGSPPQHAPASVGPAQHDSTAVVDHGFRWRCVDLTIQSAADGVRSIDCPEGEVHQGDSLIAQHDLNSPGNPPLIMAAGEVIVAHTNAAHVIE